MSSIYRHFEEGFAQAVTEREFTERRIGSELKFPLVNEDGSAARPESVDAMWEYLQSRGWAPVTDAVAGKVVGATRPGEMNDTLASCETGYCKPEFSLAHVSNLHDLDRSIGELRAELEPFAEREGVRFLGYGIQPVTPPSERLMMKKGRTSVWDRIFGANRILSPEDGDDVCLFTVNAASHVHVSVDADEAIGAVNALNGFSAAQIALTADSNVWKNRVDPEFKCVAEKLWDWWIPEPGRVGVPPKRFEDLRDYIDTVSGFRPVYVKREGKPVILTEYDSFRAYHDSDRAVGTDAEGNRVELTPESADIDLHSTCYWFNARLSRYFTVENRVNDQQPPGEMVTIAALTLGLLSALEECSEALEAHDWSTLSAGRDAACRDGLSGRVDGLELADLAGEMVDLAERGLQSRGMGEQTYLAPLRERLAERKCPADEAAELFARGGVEALIEARSL